MLYLENADCLLVLVGELTIHDWLRVRSSGDVHRIVGRLEFYINLFLVLFRLLKDLQAKIRADTELSAGIIPKRLRYLQE